MLPEIIYILILFGTIIIDYFAGIYIEQSQGKKRKLFLIISLISNISILCVFKYYNFLNENLSALLGTLGYQNHIPNLSILLPIGLSFHTFQAMSYTIEVYRGKQPAERVSIMSIHWITAVETEVRGHCRDGELGSTQLVLHLVRINGRWAVVRIEREGDS